MQPIPNGRPIRTPPNRDKPSSQKEDSVTAPREHAFDIENEDWPLGAGSDTEKADRDDGYFAAIQNGETEDGCRTTHVKLEAVNGNDGITESKFEAHHSPAKPNSELTETPSRSPLPTQPPQTPNETSLRVPASAHRLSSPPAFIHSNSLVPGPSSSGSSLQHPLRLQHRHTLEVPKVTTSRTSREYQSTNTSDDVVSVSGRFSPNTPTKRRGSMTLARRGTRSIHSDMHLEEISQDEDAARWAEHYRQKRASKRKRKEDEDDDRVVVGTKVDQNHVNWVTAYNMLTGIRFTVSRTNAKMDRELTDADFETKHKFSFDMWVSLKKPLPEFSTDCNAARGMN